MPITALGGVTVTTRPKTKRSSLNGNWNLSRHFSVFFTAEELRDDTSRDLRGMLGLNYRFR